MMCFTAMDSQFVDDLVSFVCNMFYYSKDNNSSSEIHDFNYYNQRHDLNHLDNDGKMILEILIITRDSLWKEITEASKIHSQLNKDNQDEIFAKYSNWPRDKQMQGYICKLISEKITGNYYSVHAENSSSKFMLHLMAPYSPLSKKYFQFEEYNNAINCLLLKKELKEKDKKFIEILKLFCKTANIYNFNKLDNSHKINIVNRINNIIKYCSLEKNMESKDYINNVKNIMNNIEDPLECCNILLLYLEFLITMKLSGDFYHIEFQILLLMIDKIKDNYSLEEKQIFNGIMDKLNDIIDNKDKKIHNNIYFAIKDYSLNLIRFLAHKEINNIQLLKIIIDNAKDRFGDEMRQISYNIFYHEKFHKPEVRLQEYGKFTNDQITIINHNIRELSKSDKEDRKFI